MAALQNAIRASLLRAASNRDGVATNPETTQALVDMAEELDATQSAPSIRLVDDVLEKRRRAVKAAAKKAAKEKVAAAAVLESDPSLALDVAKGEAQAAVRQKEAFAEILAQDPKLRVAVATANARARELEDRILERYVKRNNVDMKQIVQEEMDRMKRAQPRPPGLRALDAVDAVAAEGEAGAAGAAAGVARPRVNPDAGPRPRMGHDRTNEAQLANALASAARLKDANKNTLIFLAMTLNQAAYPTAESAALFGKEALVAALTPFLGEMPPAAKAQAAQRAAEHARRVGLLAE